MNCAQERFLLVSVRYPETDTVKPWLARDIGVVEALNLSRAIHEYMVRQTLPLANEYSSYVLYRPAEDGMLVQDWLHWARQKVGFHPHEGNDAGERIIKGFQFASRKQAYKVIQVGSQCLDVDRQLMLRIFDALDENDAVIGPTANGGVYLLAMREVPEKLLQNVPWDSPDACRALCEGLSSIGAEFELLDDGVIIDSIEDLRRVPQHLCDRFLDQIDEKLRLTLLGRLIGQPA
jgi:uncharacterized protein